jgi:hypothetical protein
VIEGWSERSRRLLFDNPFVKAAALGLFGLLGNVLAGAYIFEITKTVNAIQVLVWEETLRSRSFWFLMVVLVLMGFYGWGAARYETRVRKPLSEDEAYGIALQELIDPMIKAAKKDIEEGKLRTIEDIRKIFGSRNGSTQP